jgi:hypothetical protein
MNRHLALATILLRVSVALGACGPTADGKSASSTVSLVGFSTPKAADNAVEKGVTVPKAKGTLIAWVLVRDRFHGQGILEVLIDIPFALPIIVAKYLRERPD